MFKTDGFVQRGHCGAGWDSWLLNLANVADVLIFVAYMLIPIALVMLLRKKGLAVLTTERATVYVLFIATCGIGHAFKAIATVWPAYYLFVSWDCLTAAVSFYAIGVTLGEARR